MSHNVQSLDRASGWVSSIPNPFAQAKIFNIYSTRQERKRERDIQTRRLILWSLNCRLVLPPVAQVYADHGPLRALSHLHFASPYRRTQLPPQSPQMLQDASEELLYVPCVVEFSTDHLAVRPQPSNPFQMEYCGAEPLLFDLEGLTTIDGSGWECQPQSKSIPKIFYEPPAGQKDIAATSRHSQCDINAFRPRAFTDPGSALPTDPPAVTNASYNSRENVARSPVLAWKQNHQVLLYDTVKPRRPTVSAWFHSLISCLCRPHHNDPFVVDSDEDDGCCAQQKKAMQTNGPHKHVEHDGPVPWFPSYGTTWTRYLTPHSKPHADHFGEGITRPEHHHHQQQEQAVTELCDSSSSGAVTPTCCFRSRRVPRTAALRRARHKMHERVKQGVKHGSLLLFDQPEHRSLFYWLLYSVKLRTLGFLETIALHDLRKLAEIEAKFESLCHRGLVALPFNKNDAPLEVEDPSPFPPQTIVETSGDEIMDAETAVFNKLFDANSETGSEIMMAQQAQTRDEALVVWTGLLGHLRDLSVMLKVLTKHPHILATLRRPWRKRHFWRRASFKRLRRCWRRTLSTRLSSSTLSTYEPGVESMDHLVKFACWLAFIPARYLPLALHTEDIDAVSSSPLHITDSSALSAWNDGQSEAGESKKQSCLLGASRIHSGHGFQSAQPDDEYWARVARAFWTERASQVRQLMTVFGHTRHASGGTPTAEPARDVNPPTAELSHGATSSGRSERPAAPSRRRSLSGWSSLPTRAWAPPQLLAASLSDESIPSPTLSECAICLAPFDRDADIVARYPTCLHFFHPKCLLQWAAYQQNKQTTRLSWMETPLFPHPPAASSVHSNGSDGLPRAHSNHSSPTETPPGPPLDLFPQFVAATQYTRSPVNRRPIHFPRFLRGLHASLSGSDSPRRHPTMNHRIELRCPLCRALHITH
eukprot:Blabericola_migrator_1__3202@NODE_1941_length_3531_cov_12_608545_g1240_i0_p1_GENE_NODE_1941_length_3531_cov_12_608545_g1240_i0NODE_1941_length_3531_cov_12_608545_g1240_i0_p1_ORF_typecomplete_len931_score87_14zfRING_2/PF13639_6/8_2e08zfRING_2/PF13639_6/2_5e02FANCL_C/PF11793_8/8_1e06FANCL_C/PF11793_8/6_2e02zfRING_5/PF14634_6/0_002zfRING_5/PF14634_6/1e02zfRING_11/PF17123_5/0_00075zfRING_UBOX/PF13445_6/0_0014zfC3HC4/PF00097_25/0_00057zfC3HC4/PF00097_25/1_4e03zfANAPC11/PF12861_7/4_9e03zfANAPC11/PF128